MPKLSKPIQWTLILSLFAVVVVFLLPNNQPTTNSRPKTRHTTPASDANGISYDDLNAHFPLYKASTRNPFAALVEAPTAQNIGLPVIGAVSAQTSGWTLTGINTVDGVTNALVENTATNGSTFLHVGDTWQGLTVKAIDPDGIVFTNGAGQPTRLSFVTTAPDTTTPGAPAGIPSVSAITPLPPMPLAGQTRRGRRRGAQANELPSTDDSSESLSQQ